jgi:four helix bundle protein
VAKIERFEDIEAWKKGRALAAEVYRATSTQAFARDLSLRDQMRRAVVSIVSNIAEGFGRGGDTEFRQFLSNAKGSANELRAQLYVATDAGYFDEDQFQRLHALAVETDRLIAGFMRYLAESGLRGAKFREVSAAYELDLGPGTWDLGLGTWDLGPGTSGRSTDVGEVAQEHRPPVGVVGARLAEGEAGEGPGALQRPDRRPV